MYLETVQRLGLSRIFDEFFKNTLNENIFRLLFIVVLFISKIVFINAGNHNSTGVYSHMLFIICNISGCHFSKVIRPVILTY